MDGDATQFDDAQFGATVATSELGNARQTVLPKVREMDGAPSLVIDSKDRYQKVKTLGAGAAGEVTLVKDHDIRRIVAMKKLKPAAKKSELPMMRFIEEIQTTGRLEHPNIIPIHDVGCDQDGDYFYTMKYMEGETLEQIIRKLRAGDPKTHMRFSFERRTQIFVEILYAIQFAHEKNIIHRDLKPANIMVGPYGEVMVMDWGIAKKIKTEEDGDIRTETLDDLHPLIREPEKNKLSFADEGGRQFQTRHGALVGTPAYMSPEQARGDNYLVDQRSDLFGLCVIFYEFLTLSHYLSGSKSMDELFHNIHNLAPKRAESIKHQYQGRVPRELDFFLLKGLQKHPDARYQNAEEMISELQQNLEGKICVNCPSTFVKRLAHEYGHFLDNHRVIGVVIFCLLILLMLFGTVQLLLMIYHIL